MTPGETPGEQAQRQLDEIFGTRVAPTPTTAPTPEPMPLILPPVFECMPKDLIVLPQWVCWKRVLRDGAWTKQPRTPAGHAASSTNPDTWRTFEMVQASYLRGGFDGVGFVFAGQHWGADFDHCTDVAGHFLDAEIEVEVRALAAGAYVERSISGTGVHVIGLYRGAPLLGKKTALREAYVIGRYFTMTGHTVPGMESPL